MANSQDPHRPFPGSEREEQRLKQNDKAFPTANRYFRPTVLDALDLRQPEGMDGQSFLPLLVGNSLPGSIFSCTADPKNSMILKMIQTP